MGDLSYFQLSNLKGVTMEIDKLMARVVECDGDCDNCDIDHEGLGEPVGRVSEDGIIRHLFEDMKAIDLDPRANSGIMALATLAGLGLAVYKPLAHKIAKGEEVPDELAQLVPLIQHSLALYGAHTMLEEGNLMGALHAAVESMKTDPLRGGDLS